MAEEKKLSDILHTPYECYQTACRGGYEGQFDHFEREVLPLLVKAGLKLAPERVGIALTNTPAIISAKLSNDGKTMSTAQFERWFGAVSFLMQLKERQAYSFCGALVYLKSFSDTKDYDWPLIFDELSDAGYIKMVKWPRDAHIKCMDKLILEPTELAGVEELEASVAEKRELDMTKAKVLERVVPKDV